MVSNFTETVEQALRYGIELYRNCGTGLKIGYRTLQKLWSRLKDRVSNFTETVEQA